MKKTKEQKGITLIALIITIVVLLILAVVAINSIQNDGIISHTGNTANTYNQAVKNEQDQLQNYLDYLDKANGGSKTYASYTTGQEVKVMADVDEDGVEEEHPFYVIEDSSETEEKVLLLAKGNINTTTLTQESPNSIAFSETNYWSTIEGITYPYDLTETGEPEANKYALRAAYDYGIKIGGTGRLMTYDEAIALQSSYSDILYGTEIDGLWYWLGSAGSGQNVWEVIGMAPGMYTTDVYEGDWCKVRPVVQISKDLVTLVT